MLYSNGNEPLDVFIMKTEQRQPKKKQKQKHQIQGERQKYSLFVKKQTGNRTEN